MAAKLGDSNPDTERTDEYPVLTEDSLERTETVAAGTDSVDRLDQSVESLQTALEQAEGRWNQLESRLESRLEAQEDAISELRRLLGDPEASAPELEAIPELTDILVEVPAKAADPSPAAADPASTGTTPAESDAPNQAMLERIAALESYIEGRTERWQEMERALENRERRIEELEQELAQRVSRELGLEQRLHDEGKRLRALRDKIRQFGSRPKSEDEEAAHRPDAETLEFMTPAAPILTFSSRAARRKSESAGPVLLALNGGTPERYALTGETTTIGRTPDCDIQIPANVVSRHHAAIRHRSGETLIEDLGSTNGVFVNANRVDKTRLSNGDWITIGEARFRYVTEDSAD